MKLITLLCLLCFFSISKAQNQGEIDQRLFELHGEKLIQLYENNKEYYNFLLYELNNSFYIVENTQINTDFKENYRNINSVKDKEGNPFDISLLANPDTFNFFNYSFERAQNERTVYDLGDGRLLIFYSLTEIKENYKK